MGELANSFKYSTDAPPTSIPEVAMIIHGPPSITFFLSCGDPTWLKAFDVNGFLSAKMFALSVLDRKSGYAVWIALISQIIPSM